MKMTKDEGSDLLMIMDTTLRDGEQTSGVSFSDVEKLGMARILLEDVKVDRIEVASARVSEGEFRGAVKILDWAASRGYLDRVEILGFVDGDVSLDWIRRAGGRVINLLCKGSYRHVTEQLRKTPEQHLADIGQVIGRAREMGIRVNIYLEDWSNGMRNSREYVHRMMAGLRDEGVSRIMLPDTLGILNPDEVYLFCREMLECYPGVDFDFHPHNDYDLAAGNVFMALKAGIRCVHTTVNGLGERAGNVPLASVIATATDHLKLRSNVNEQMLNRVSRVVESFSGVRIPANKPLIGEFVFTSAAGSMPTGTPKTIFTTTNCSRSGLAGFANMPWGRLPGKPTLRKTLKTLALTWTRSRSRRSPTVSSNWAIRRRTCRWRIFPISLPTC